MPPTAADIAKALKARKRGGGWMALCPAHKETTPSLSINEGKDGKPLVHCFGGCPQDTVISALKYRGAWHDGAFTPAPYADLKVSPVTAEITEEEKNSIASCRRAWDAAVPIGGTNAQLYLQGRGIISNETPLPTSLRYLEIQNALIAAFTKPNSDDLVGLQAIFLEADGLTKKKKLSFGPVRHGHVKLAGPAKKMQVTESIEDGLALMQMNAQPTLAVAGTTFLARHFMPPKECQTITLAPDNDDAGREAIETAMIRLHLLGFTVRVLRPPADRDWCDVLPEFEERQAITSEADYV